MKEVVYWIRHKKHTDITKEGYVGVSNNHERRWQEHKDRTNTKSHLRNALDAYKDDIIFEVFCETNDIAHALKIEETLRPEEHIGWNHAKGGGYPPRPSQATKGKISATLKSLRTNPYSAITHSKETLTKSKETKRLNNLQWYHNPKTGEARMIKTANEEIPAAWKRGRVTKIKQPGKTRGVDYTCNSKQWILEIDGIEHFKGSNLKKYLKDNGFETIYNNLTKAAKNKTPYKSTKYKKIFTAVIL